MEKNKPVRSVPTVFATLGLGVALTLLADSQHSFAKVGVTAAVNPSTRGTAPGGAARIKSLGENVVFNERIETDADGLAQILLIDGTTFTVGPNSALTIDKFVYDRRVDDLAFCGVDR